MDFVKGKNGVDGRTRYEKVRLRFLRARDNQINTLFAPGAKCVRIYV